MIKRMVDEWLLIKEEIQVMSNHRCDPVNQRNTN